MSVFSNPELVEKILEDRYYTPNENDWSQVAQRVARYVASAGIAKGMSLDLIKSYEEAFFQMINDRVFLPNSPALFNAGFNTPPELLYGPAEIMSMDDYQAIFDSRADNGSLSACFVLDVQDSMESIYTTLLEMALITQAGGGVGFDFSPLRPKGSPVNGAGGVASGPLPFAKAYDVSADAIKQGGKRRAALMGILDYTHPDALDFIDAKRDNDGKSVLSYFNISLDVDPEEFSKALDDDGEIEFYHERTGVTGSISAREYLHRIADNAWRSGDPGMVFTSRHNKYSAISNIERINATNPCGEQQLLPYQSCVLGSIDISKIDMDDLAEFYYYVNHATLFLDNIVDINAFPLDALLEKNLYYRDVGLGLMGIHDYLIQNGLSYDSHAGRIAVAKVAGSLSAIAYMTSAVLAENYGAAPSFSESRWVKEEGFVPFPMMDHPDMEETNAMLQETFDFVRAVGLRNISVTTIAPTGTISQIAECSSGIEPNFMFAYNRTMVNKHGDDVNLRFVHSDLGSFASPEQVEEIIKTGSAYEVVGDPVYKSAMEIAPEDHLMMQSVAQCYLTNSISKTINLPNSATVEDVERICRLAMKMQVKGFTCFRDGSLGYQILNSPDKEVEEKGEVSFFTEAPQIEGSHSNCPDCELV